MLLKGQRGIASLIVVVGILLGLGVIGGGYVVSNQLAAGTNQTGPSESRSVSLEGLGLGVFKSSGTGSGQFKEKLKVSTQSAQTNQVAAQAESAPQPQSAFDRLLQRFNLQSKSTPTPTPMPTSPPAASVTVPTTASASPANSNSTTMSIAASPSPVASTTTYTTSTPTPSPSYSGYALCEVHTNPTSGSAPLSVQLIYAMAVYGNVGANPYVKEVQWDWDGDGNWDTDYSVNNQQLSHIYTSPGTYPLRMHLKLSTGYETQVCTGSITIS